MVYANADDYAAYTGKPAPDGIDAVLARASERIDELLVTAVYAVDPATELPTDEKVADAIRRATCAQAAWSVAVGDPYGVAAAFKSVSIGSVKLDRAGGGEAGPARHAPDAASILRVAGLLPGFVIDQGAW
ncbi:hypothetical protein [Nonomuraea wenchangensis]|uniref:Uncharacterized protein n=1 Tax=Nonomuraea wenchangensis TaxID=568860 RepID=A0A1I0LV88_9ACTN|nr:hypothetical protein [Nonomuraea wenchangensis]SEU46606.1 hypothetical protein SAMN05421811_12792 [Nonomuraea wenchangensis]